MENNKEPIKFTDLELIFNNLKKLFDNHGYLINWKEFEKQDLNETINTLAMASPFTLEENKCYLKLKILIIEKKNLSR